MRHLLMKLWKPLFIENSKIPVWLSYIAPIDIGAITLGPIVISRDEMSKATKRHETNPRWNSTLKLHLLDKLSCT